MVNVTSAVEVLHGAASESATLEELDASVDSGLDVPEEEIAARYYSDEAMLAAIRLRRRSRVGTHSILP